MSQTRWRLAHWRRHCRCTKVSLGHHAGLQNWYPAARRRRVMVKGPRIRRSSPQCPLQDLAIGTLCDTRNLSNINLVAPFTRELNNELHYFIRNKAWHRLNKIQIRSRFNRWHSSESNHICPFRWPITLTSNESAHSKLHEMYRRAIPYRNPSRPLPETGLYVLKSITANPIHFVVIKTKISLQRQNIPRNWPAMYHWKLLKYVNICTTNSFIIILWIVKNAVQKFEISIISHLLILSSLQ